MSFWTVENIARITGGQLTNRKQPTAQGVAPHRATPATIAPPAPCGICIDSRSVRPAQVFVALKGEHADAHRFIADAAARGASMALATNPVAISPAPPPGFPILVVPDATAAIGVLAAAYRDALTNTLVIAATGSAGKTTTTRLIAAALSGGGLRGTHPAKSFNNSIGVPFTILNAAEGDDFLVCEVGTSAPGEINALARIIRPDIAVITSIGRAHAQFLGGIDGVAREKSALLRHTRPGPRSLRLIPTPCPPLESCASGVADLLRFGPDTNADIPLGRVEMTPEGVRFQINATRTHPPAWFSIPMLGEHNAMNAAAAVAIARHAGLSDDHIRRGLSTAKGAAMRLERRRIGDIDLINDAYNANPESMRAAIATLAALSISPGARRVLILGDMLELGDHSAAAHAEVLAVIAEHPGAFGLVVALGHAMNHAAQHAALATPLATEPDFDDAAADRVAALLRPGDAVLLKGSRGTRVERVAQALERIATPV